MSKKSDDKYKINLSKRDRASLEKAIGWAKNIITKDTAFAYHNGEHGETVSGFSVAEIASLMPGNSNAALLAKYAGLMHDAVYRGSSKSLSALELDSMGRNERNPFPQWVSRFVKDGFPKDAPAEEVSARIASGLLINAGFKNVDLVARVENAIRLTAIGEKNFAARAAHQAQDPLALALMQADLRDSIDSPERALGNTLDLSLEDAVIRTGVDGFLKKYNANPDLNNPEVRKNFCNNSLAFFSYVVKGLGTPDFVAKAAATEGQIKQMAESPNSQDLQLMQSLLGRFADKVFKKGKADLFSPEAQSALRSLQTDAATLQMMQTGPER